MASANAKLILVDGFAGSGKSMAAQRLGLSLVSGGRVAHWFHEHQSRHIDVRSTYDRRDSARRFERQSRMVNEVLAETARVRA